MQRYLLEFKHEGYNNNIVCSFIVETESYEFANNISFSFAIQNNLNRYYPKLIL